MSTFAGSTTGEYGYREDTGTEALFLEPMAIAHQFDAGTDVGRLLVADKVANHFRTIDLQTGLSKPDPYVFVVCISWACVCLR